MDIQLLREQLHAAVDATIDRFLAGTLAPAVATGVPDVVAGATFTGWTYNWPDKSPEEFDGRDYEVRSRERTLHVRLGWTVRRAWGRDRRRAVVFVGPAAPADPTYYPATEFVETDDGRFAAAIPDPSHPRSLVKEGADLPSWFARAVVERADALFRSIGEGPTLRVVLAAEDEVSMVRHGCWVALLRRRV